MVSKRSLKKAVSKTYKESFLGVSRKSQVCFKNFFYKNASRVFQRVFNEVLFFNFDLACISSQLPEQKEGLLI